MVIRLQVAEIILDEHTDRQTTFLNYILCRLMTPFDFFKCWEKICLAPFLPSIKVVILDFVKMTFFTSENAKALSFFTGMAPNSQETIFQSCFTGIMLSFLNI